ncbi:MAG: DNA polymerase IV [Gemmatimonadota bacterium]|nr:MAG: DNA polymerase IV [Gemmatimonadota bacterium]
MSRTILHADMDAFFAAVEARENEQIADRPIVVGADPRGGRGRGVVAACNYPARRFGIHSAMPISEAFRRCPHAVFLRPRMQLYAQVSTRIMHLLETYTDQVEQLSIDEAFLDVTASTRLFGDGITIARRIKQHVREQEGLTVSIGVAPNKFLAKLASDLQKPDGLVIVEPGDEIAFLQPLPIERLWGVGPKTAGRLHSLGIRTIGDVAALPLPRLERLFGRAHAHHLHALARGQDERPVQPDRERKQISRETTFLHDTDDRDLVEQTLLDLCEEIAARLRRRHLVARTISIKFRFAPFHTLTRRLTVDYDFDTTDVIFPIARQLLLAADPGDRPIRLVGIGVSGLRQRTPNSQLTLFEESDRGAERVARAVDAITDRFGHDAVKRARLLRDRNRPRDDRDD